MTKAQSRPQCELCGEPADYVINGTLYFCGCCRSTIGEEWEDVITVEELESDDNDEDET